MNPRCELGHDWSAPVYDFVHRCAREGCGAEVTTMQFHVHRLPREGVEHLDFIYARLRAAAALRRLEEEEASGEVE